ncbi:MAG: hypothetical protein ACOC46_04080, partial [Pirellulales bacterium]
MSAHSPGIYLCLLGLVCVLPVQPAHAQQPDSASAGATASAAAPETPPARVELRDLPLRVMEGDEGRPVLVPGLTLERLEQLLAGEARRPADHPPPFSVTELVLDGEAGSRYADLTATISVQLMHAAAVRIPLSMREAHLRSAPRDELITAAADGYEWWVEGKG